MMRTNLTISIQSPLVSLVGDQRRGQLHKTSQQDEQELSAGELTWLHGQA